MKTFSKYINEKPVNENEGANLKTLDLQISNIITNILTFEEALELDEGEAERANDQLFKALNRLERDLGSLPDSKYLAYVIGMVLRSRGLGPY